jgi:predicted acetyltransferase
MNTSLSPVLQKDRKVLANMLFKYEKEILGKDAPSEYKYLDTYWSRNDSFPFFIMLDEKRAGFVLINKYTLVTKDAYSVSEFYISKEFRKKDIGKGAAFKTFDLFPGNWEIREIEENINAQRFWRKVIDSYTNGKFEEIILNNDQWHGPVQTFNSK